MRIDDKDMVVIVRYNRSGHYRVVMRHVPSEVKLTADVRWPVHYGQIVWRAIERWFPGAIANKEQGRPYSDYVRIG